MTQLKPLTKYARLTNAQKLLGKPIVHCGPKCARVYHLGWRALSCSNCNRMIKKTEWQEIRPMFLANKTVDWEWFSFCSCKSYSVQKWAKMHKMGQIGWNWLILAMDNSWSVYPNLILYTHKEIQSGHRETPPKKTKNRTRPVNIRALVDYFLGRVGASPVQAYPLDISAVS